jgi:hypothetical protein
MLNRTVQRLSAAAELLRPASIRRTLARVDELAATTQDLARTTRSLSAALEDLRLRTEQLITLQTSNAERQHDLERLSQVLDTERISAHVSSAIEAAPLHHDPFPHIVVQKWLPPEVYRTVVAAVPPSIFFADQDPSRQRLKVPFFFGPQYSTLVWRFMSEEIIDRIVHEAISRKFAEVVREYVATWCPALPPDLDLSLVPSDGRIMLRRPGYVIAPHRDPKWGFLTGLVYLVRKGDREEYGTQLYRVHSDGEAPTSSPFYIETGKCELVKDVPFRANTLLVFLNSRGAHGASIPADAQPPNLERYVYQFRLGPPNHVIGQLLQCMPEEQRKLWEGSKSRKASGGGDYM